MASCKCGATVIKAQTEMGDSIILESFSEPIGDDRYTLRFHAGDPFWEAPLPTAVKLDGSSPIDGYQEHKVRCPYQQ